MADNDDPAEFQKSDSPGGWLLRSLRATKNKVFNLLKRSTEEGHELEENTATQESVTPADDRYDAVQLTADEQPPDEYSSSLSNKINFLEQQIKKNQTLAEELEQKEAELAQDDKLYEFLNSLSVELVEYMNKQPLPVVSQTREEFMTSVRQQFYRFLEEHPELQGEASEKSITFLLKQIEDKYNHTQKVMLEFGTGIMTQVLKTELNECIEKMKQLQLSTKPDPEDDSEVGTSEEAGPSRINQ